MVAPVITSANTVSNVEGTVLSHTLTADKSVTWTAVGGADLADFEISGSTLRWVGNGVKAFVTDTTAPTLTFPTDAADGSDGATLTVTTNEANGTLYFFVSTSATPPTAVALKAGTGATVSGSQGVTATGAQNVPVATGLTASTLYYAHFLHRDAAGNDSAIVSGDGFTTAAPLPLKVIFEGDSISSTSFTFAMSNTWMANNPAVASANISNPGAKINGTNSLTERIPDLVTAANATTNILCLLIGANDLYLTSTYPSAADWQNALLTYIASARTAASGIKIGVGTLLPVDEAQQIARAGFNARRAIVNPWLRGQVGTTIDFLIPYGEHPFMGTDSAAATSLFSDGLHPAAGGAGHMLETLNAALDPVVAGATGTIPSAFTFADFASATTSTVYTTQKAVTGMGMGQSSTASVSGVGEYARGALPGGISYGTGAQTIMNGDILMSRVTSSASEATLVQHTLSMGPTSDTWDITTAVNPATTIYSTTYKHASATIQTERQAYGSFSINGPQVVFATTGKTTGKHYFEMTFYTPPVTGGAGVFQVAVGGPSNATNNMPGALNNIPGATYRQGGTVRHLNGTTATTISGKPTFGISDSIGVCIDADNDRVWFLKNGVSIDGDPAIGTGGYPLNPVATASWWAAAVPQREDGHKINFGQDPFNHAPPNGFVAYN